MEQFLLDQTFPGSDNSWKVRLWQDYENKVELCTTKWLDRPGINDWEAGSSVQWKSKMDNPSENYFGTCLHSKLNRENLPMNLSIEFLGYHKTDHIKIERALVAFSSPTWLTNPLKFQGSKIGWSDTNYQSYQDGGIHVLSALTLLNPEFHCCRDLKLEGHSKVDGIYQLVKSTQNSRFWAYKHQQKFLEIFRR